MRQAAAVSNDHRQAGHYPVPPMAASERLKRIIRMVLSGTGLFLIIMTLEPFPGDGGGAAGGDGGGNIINQVGYLGLAMIYMFALLTLVDRRVLMKAVSPAWILVFAIAFWSAGHAHDPGAATRGVLLTLVSMTLIAGTILLPAREKDFVNAGATAVLIILVINYAAIVLKPELATHTAAGGEPWHAGSWRGHLVHKNFTAPVFSVITMFGLYCWRAGAPLRGSLIFILGAIFVINTDSKTTSGFLPLAIIIVLAIALTHRPRPMLFVHLVLTALIACLTIGTVMAPGLLAITRSLIEDSTFTGRDEIWRMGLSDISRHFWEGFGYFSYWLSPAVQGKELNYEAAWDVREIISGHNTYMDALLTLGVPCGLITIFILMLKPLSDYLKAHRQPANRPLADFFLMVVIFMTYTGMMETFLLNRADPMWLVFALGAFGLTVTARGTVLQDVRRD